MMDRFPQQQPPGDPFALTRRHFVRDCSMGLGAMALAALSAEEGAAAEGPGFEPLAARKPHFAPS
ncbi:MAG: twin-arginine translocation signal domain-containing protein, partial [Planctomycetes bacterium]|nr:twin-arginine translocation signal domain-containing protein [Planctomycetota bacterium]